MGSHLFEPAAIKALHRAIEKSGCAIVLSNSPAPVPLSEVDFFEKHAQMWRVPDDFGDLARSDSVAGAAGDLDLSRIPMGSSSYERGQTVPWLQQGCICFRFLRFLAKARLLKELKRQPVPQQHALISTNHL
jgi:hypothetical protein